MEVEMKIKNVSLKAEILLRQQPGRAGAGDILQFYYERERERERPPQCEPDPAVETP